MTIYNITDDVYIQPMAKNWFVQDKQFFITGYNSEIAKLNKVFRFDPNTILECVNLDENIRFESYSSYDFISLIYFYYQYNEIIFSEINLYVGKNYIFLILPHDEKVSGEFVNYFRNIKEIVTEENFNISDIYYKIFHKIMKDLFETMEKYEDIIDDTLIKVIKETKKEFLFDIINIKSTTGKIKKQLRPLLHIGDQFIMNENGFIPQDKIKFFKNIDVRMNKIYDFAVNLNEMSEQLLNTYDSKINIQTNEIVTKLTIITVFISPLTVITGIYGMNFTFMPELNTKYGYFIILFMMVLIVIVLYTFFKKKGYL